MLPGCSSSEVEASRAWVEVEEGDEDERGELYLKGDGGGRGFMYNRS